MNIMLMDIGLAN